MEIQSVTPNGVEQGTTSRVTIKGIDFPANFTVTVSGTGITVENASLEDAETITADFAVSRMATIGFRDVSVVPSAGPTAVLTAGLAITNFQSLTRQLRLLAGERIPPGKSDTDTNFSDEELIDIILQMRGNLYLSAANIWESKAAEYADLVDVTESGSERKLSQLFKNASAQRDSYQEAGMKLEEAMLDPVVGESVPWLWPGSSTALDPSADPFYDPFLFIFAQRLWTMVSNGQVAMYGGRLL